MANGPSRTWNTQVPFPPQFSLGVTLLPLRVCSPALPPGDVPGAGQKLHFRTPWGHFQGAHCWGVLAASPSCLANFSGTGTSPRATSAGTGVFRHGKRSPEKSPFCPPVLLSSSEKHPFMLSLLTPAFLLLCLVFSRYSLFLLRAEFQKHLC